MLLEIVTPEEKVYSEQVESVVLPTVEGEVGILPGHIPLLTMLDPGELQIAADGKIESLAVDKGFARVYGDKVSVLTEAAINVEEIDLSEVEKAQQRAEKALEEAEKEGMDPAEIERLESLVRFSLQQKLLKRKRQ